jgi:hypothetical protein
MEVDTPLEEKVTKINESIQGFHTNIVDFESRTTPSTPPEERKKREKTTMTTVESIRSLDEECTNYMKNLHNFGLSLWRM